MKRRRLRQEEKRKTRRNTTGNKRKENTFKEKQTTITTTYQTHRNILKHTPKNRAHQKRQCKNTETGTTWKARKTKSHRKTSSMEINFSKSQAKHWKVNTKTKNSVKAETEHTNRKQARHRKTENATNRQQMMKHRCNERRNKNKRNW